jgi:hypothetical protein
MTWHGFITMDGLVLEFLKLDRITSGPDFLISDSWSLFYPMYNMVHVRSVYLASRLTHPQCPHTAERQTSNAGHHVLQKEETASATRNQAIASSTMAFDLSKKKTFKECRSRNSNSRDRLRLHG